MPQNDTKVKEKMTICQFAAHADYQNSLRQMYIAAAKYGYYGHDRDTTPRFLDSTCYFAFSDFD